MGSVASSDAAFQILCVCRDGIRFRFGKVQEVKGNKALEEPVLPCVVQWLTAASPPPLRDGFPWQDGLRLNDPSPEGEYPAFQLVPGDLDPQWRKVGVYWDKDIAPLDMPCPHTLVLDQGIVVQRADDNPGVLQFTAEPDPLAFLSTEYDQPLPAAALPADVRWRYYGEFELPWKRHLSPGDYVALSTEGFEFGRGSADVIMQVRQCNLSSEPRPNDEPCPPPLSR
jgi:hypothetical protein